MIAEWVIVFLYGLVFGSFYNVCIYRIPLSKSIVNPPSHCGKCNHKLKWYHNIPLLSYLVLKGKCGFCRAPFSLRYPGVELLTGIIAVVLYAHFVSLLTLDNFIQFVIAFIFCSGLIVFSFIDFDYYIIPDRFTVGGFFVSVLVSGFFPNWHGFNDTREGFIFSLMSGLLCFLVMWGIRIAGEWAFKKEAMGFGDVKLMAALGGFLGWKGGFGALFIGCLAGSLWGMILMGLKRFGKQAEIPFGPFLAIGAFVNLIWHQQWLDWYWKYLGMIGI